MKIDWNKKYTTIAVYALLTFLACYFIFKFTNNWENTKKNLVDLLQTLSPFMYAIAIAYFLNPMVTWIEEKLLHPINKAKIRRACSIFVTYIIVLGLSVILLSFILPQLVSSLTEVVNLPLQYRDDIEKIVDDGQIPVFDDYNIDLTYVNDYLSENIASTFNSLSSVVQEFTPILLGYVQKIVGGLFNVILGLIIAIYLLMSKETALLTARKVVFALLPPKKAIYVINLSKESNEIFISFIIGKLIDSLIIGIICFICLLIFNFPYALLLAVIVGITNIIPYFGPFIGGFIGFALLLFINPIQALWYMLFIVILQQFDGNILGPKILGDSTGLSPFWVIFAIIIFGKFFGVVGMFLGVPVFAVIRNIVKRQIDHMYNNRMTTM